MFLFNYPPLLDSVQVGGPSTFFLNQGLTGRNCQDRFHSPRSERCITLISKYLLGEVCWLVFCDDSTRHAYIWDALHLP